MDRLPTTKTKTVPDFGRIHRHIAQDNVFEGHVLERNFLASNVLDRHLAVDELSGPENTHGPNDPRTEYHLRESRRQLEQISLAAKAFSLQLDFQRLLADIAAHGYEIVRSDQVVVYSSIDNNLQAEVQYPPSSSLDLQISDDVRWCVRYLEAKISNNSRLDNSGIRNSICVPFVASQNQVLGVIEFRNKRTGGTFNEPDARIAICLARLATSALDRARLFFRIEEWKQSIETLLSFNATVNQQLEPEEMVRELVANVTGFLDADGGVAGIALRDEECAIVQANGFYFANEWHPYARSWKPGEGVPGLVLDTEFPYLIGDYQTDPLSDPLLVKKYDLGSCICVPIKNAHEQVLGFFQLHRRSGQPEFSWQDAAFLESLGNTAAVAIENARLVKSLEIKHAQMRTLSEGHVHRLEEERQRIARELHDETGQVLVGLKLRLKVLSGLLTEDQGDARLELEELGKQLGNATVRLKVLAKKLRPPTLDELGFEATLRQLVAEFRRDVDFSIHLEIHPTSELTSLAETALYRIAQECLTNVAKHAKANRVDVFFRKEGDHHTLRISDDGIGYDIESSTEGLGHIGIRERVRMLGGGVHVRSSLSKGTTVEVIVPKGDAQ